MLASDFHVDQPTSFRIALNGRPVALHHNVDGGLEITALISTSKNTNEFSESVVTLGTGSGNTGRTLYLSAWRRAEGHPLRRRSPPCPSKFARWARSDRRPFFDTRLISGRWTRATHWEKPPSPFGPHQRIRVIAFGDFRPSQPADFEVILDGEAVATVNSKGNTDLTPFLKPGKNVATVTYVLGKNTNEFSFSSLTAGPQVVEKWNSVVKWGVGKADLKAGAFTFPIYRPADPVGHAGPTPRPEKENALPPRFRSRFSCKSKKKRTLLCQRRGTSTAPRPASSCASTRREKAAAPLAASSSVSQMTQTVRPEEARPKRRRSSTFNPGPVSRKGKAQQPSRRGSSPRAAHSNVRRRAPRNLQERKSGSSALSAPAPRPAAGCSVLGSRPWRRWSRPRGRGPLPSWPFGGSRG